MQWARAGRGIVLRSVWDVRPLLESGQLQQILPDVTQPANVWAVYPARLAQSAKVRVCVDFLCEAFVKGVSPWASRQPRRASPMRGKEVFQRIWQNAMSCLKLCFPIALRNGRLACFSPPKRKIRQNSGITAGL